MRYEKPLLEKLVNESNSYSEVARKLGLNADYYGNRQTVKRYIELFGISVSHFGNYRCGKNINNKKVPLEEILVENSSYRDTRKVKEKLYIAGIKKRECELCGQGEIWNGKKMSLILDHINGVNDDNRIENLRIVCPNCNATLDTHCRGHNKTKKNEIKKKKKMCNCGNLISDKSETCKKCSSIKQRKKNRPMLDILIKDIKDLGYVGTGKKYGVSDNAIRKWIKFYKNNIEGVV